MRSVLITLIASLLPLMAAAQMEPGKIKVFQAKGAVKQIDNMSGDSGPVKRGSNLTEGHTVVTGPDSSAYLMFSNGSTIVLDENSSLIISSFKQAPFDRSKGTWIALKEDPSQSDTMMYLNYGELVGRVKKLQPTSLYDVQTAIGTTGVRGTTFITGFYQDKSTNKYVMKVGNVSGKVTITSNMPVDMIVNDMGVAEGEMDPTNTLSTGDVPEQSLVLLMARQEVIKDRILTDVPEKEKDTGFEEPAPAPDVPPPNDIAGNNPGDDAEQIVEDTPVVEVKDPSEAGLGTVGTP